MKPHQNPFYDEGRARYAKQAKGPKQTWKDSFYDQMSAFEVELLCRALREAKGHIGNAAEMCGLSRTSFDKKLITYAISAKGFK